jgi:hypothetical protein
VDNAADCDPVLVLIAILILTSLQTHPEMLMSLPTQSESISQTSSSALQL